MSVIAGYFVLVTVKIPKSERNTQNVRNMFLNIQDSTKAEVALKPTYKDIYSEYGFSFYFPRKIASKLDLNQKAKSLAKNIKKNYSIVFGNKLKVTIQSESDRDYGYEVEINRPRRRRARR